MAAVSRSDFEPNPAWHCGDSPACEDNSKVCPGLMPVDAGKCQTPLYKTFCRKSCGDCKQRVAPAAATAMAAATTATPEPVRPGVIEFTRLWVSSADGHTHLQHCTIKNLTKHPLPGGSTAQYVRDLAGEVQPTDLIFTQMLGDNPWHQCPTSQFVIPMSGSWRVNTTDGDSVVMGPGHVFYQDDYKGLETAGGVKPVHFSASVGGPCNQLVISAAGRAAVMDDRSCDWAKQAAPSML